MQGHSYYIHLISTWMLLLLSAAASETVRVVTKEELARHDGKQEKEYWLSLMSEVYDVTAGAAEWYAEGEMYNVFIGRDANVPFITGKFDAEEAAKPISQLEPMDLKHLQEYWLKFYQDEERYPFVGYLVGDLYDEEGQSTYDYYIIQEKIAEAKQNVEAKKREVYETVRQRDIEIAERERRMAEEKEVYWGVGPWRYRVSKLRRD